MGTEQGNFGTRNARRACKWMIGLLLALLVSAPAGLAYADSNSFDYRTLKPNGSESAAALTAKQVTFNGASWYLTAYDENAGTVTLFAAGQIGTSKFDADSSDYAGSDIQAYLDALTAAGGSYAAVAPAIAPTDLADVGVTGAKLYLLSENELNAISSNVRRLSPTDNSWLNYWLRTKGPNTWTGTPQAKNCYPAAWTGTPMVGEAVVTDASKAVRPALKLNLNRVDFDAANKTFTVKQTVTKTVTFKVENGAWDDGTDADKTVTLTGYPGELKLAESDIPAVGSNPSVGYKAGAWDVAPSTETSITEDTTYTYSYAKKQPISFTVTFKVRNGSWSDETTDDKVVTLAGVEGDELKLSAADIPAVGDKPAEGYVAGSWDVVPVPNTVINQNKTYTYTYEDDGKIAATVTFAVVNGTWGDGSADSKTVALEGTDDNPPKLSTDQIPAVGENPADGYKAGAWDVAPSTETAITSDTTYTYTYAAKEPISATVTFKVVNGAWDDETEEDVIVTLEGLEGDELKLSAEQIPAVGGKPAQGYKAGSWDVEPSTEDAIAEPTTYTYTFAAREPADDIKDLIPTENESMDEVLAKRVNFNGFQWYVIDYDDENGTCTLFASEKIDDNSWFDDFSNVYKTSAIKGVVDAMTAEGGLFEGAAENIKDTNLTDINPYVENAKMFLLGTAEAKAVPVNARKYGEEYWLRSQPSVVPGGAVHVYNDVVRGPGTVGEISGSSVQLPKAVRPALKIDLGTTEFVKETKTFVAGQNVTAPEAAQGLAYTGEEQELLASPAVVARGNDAEGAIQYSLDGQTWSTDIPKATIPGDYTVYYKVEGNEAYEAFECTEPVNVKVNKGTPEVPNPLTATYGQTLQDVKYRLILPLPEGWSWKDPVTTSVGDAGENTFLAKYESTDPYIDSMDDVALTVYVAKADQDAPAAPTLGSSTSSSITLEAIDNGEYKCGEGEWQASPTFDGLDPNTEYTFYQRLAEDGNHNASEASEGAAFTTDDGKIAATVTFAVVNGAWGDGTAESKAVVLEGTDDNPPKLAADQIPAVGENPAEGYKAGAWDVAPSTETAITADTTYTYTYAAKESVSVTVTFKVVNGAWDDEMEEDVIVTLEGLEGDELKLSADDIPAVGGKPAQGYKAGAWDVEPSTEEALTEDVTYTYTFVAREPADDIKDLIPAENDSMDEVLAKRVNFNGFQWYVIAYDDKSNTCTLFASDKIGNNSWFDGFSNVYKTSAIKGVVDAMTAEGGLFYGTADKIKDTNLTDINPYVENVKMFLLGTEEAKAVPVNARKYGEEYWLRSQSTTWGDGGAAQVKADGTVGEAAPNTSSVQLSKAVRPALKIDLGTTEFVTDTKTFKAGQNVTAPEAAQGLAYTGEEQQLLSSPVVVKRGNDAEGAIEYSLDGQTWSTEIPTATVPGDYTVYYKVAGNGEFDEFVCAEPVAVTINKAEPDKPQVVFATYGQTLADVASLLPDGWSWADPRTSVGDAGINSFLANYVSPDEYHKDMTGVDVNVWVCKADQEPPAAPEASETTPSSITLAAIENGEYSMDGETWQDSPAFTGLDANTEYTFYQRLKEDDNHNASPSSEGAAIKTGSQPIASIDALSAVTYNTKAQTPAVTVKDANGKTVPATAYTVKYANNTNAGTATATATAKAGSGYSGSAKATFKVNPASIAKATVAVAGQSYTGKALKPAPTVKLAIGGKTVTLKAGTDYTAAYKNNTKAGTATVTVTGKGNYTGSASGSFAIKSWVRLFGSNALKTMEKITQAYGKATTAVVATNADFKDSLAGAALAGSLNAPMLTTSKGALSDQTASELKRMGVKTVYLVGGTAEVSAGTESQIKALGIAVTRVSGAPAQAAGKAVTSTAPTASAATASERAIACAKLVKGRSDTVIVATQNNFKDALAISPYAYATKSPILYAEGNKALSAATLSYIKSAKFKKAIIVGGPVALPTSIEAQLKSAGIAAASITRLAGSNQYKTAQVIAEWACGKLKNGTGGGSGLYQYASVKFQPAAKMTADKLGVARADDNKIGWKDALAGAALCGKNKGVLLLADAKNSAQAAAFVKANKAQISMGYVFGGTLAVPKDVMDKLVNASL